MKNVLITGGAGYIGSHTVNYLLKHGFKNIVIIDSLENGNEDLLPTEVIFIKTNLSNKIELENAFKKYSFDAIIHFAAYAYVGESMKNPGKYFQNNISCGINILELMVKYKCNNIVFSSTCSIYGDIDGFEKINENFNVNPLNPYAKSKLIFENIMQWYKDIYNINFISLRYFNAAGAAFDIGEKHEPETHLIPLVVNASLDNKKIFKIFGTDYDTEDGTCIRDFIHVVDLADAHFRAMKYLFENNSSEIINLGTGQGYSVKDIVHIVEKYSNSNINVIYENRREGDPSYLVADNQKAKALLNWIPKHDINDIISSAYNWHKKNYKENI